LYSQFVQYGIGAGQS